MLRSKKFHDRIIEEAICQMPPTFTCDKNRVNNTYTDDGRELLLDDVTEVLNEIYQTLMKDYKSRFKKP